jgi:cell division protein FtsA
MNIFPIRKDKQKRPARTARPGMVAALDFGNAKIACAIGQSDGQGHVEILGAATLRSEGMRSGVIHDLEAAENVIRDCVAEAEACADIGVSELVATFQSRDVKISKASASIPLAPDRPVDDRDLRRALEATLEPMQGVSHKILHALPAGWTLDAQQGLADPRGLFGQEIASELTVITAPHAQLRNLAVSVERAQLTLHSVVASPYVAGLGALVPEEREIGAYLIDMGAGLTSITHFAQNRLQKLAILPVGGQHATGDLSYGLNISLIDAERLKCLHGAVVTVRGSGSEELVLIHDSTSGEARTLRRGQIHDILGARLEETVELLEAGLIELYGAAGCPAGRVVSVGGASQLRGLGDLLRHGLDSRHRQGAPRAMIGMPGAMAAPGFAALVGTLHHALHGPREARLHRRRSNAMPRLETSERERGAIGRAAVWLREHF